MIVRDMKTKKKRMVWQFLSVCCFFVKFGLGLCLLNFKTLFRAHIKQPQPIGLELYCFVLLFGANFSAWLQCKLREKEKTTTTIRGAEGAHSVKFAKRRERERREKGRKREEKRGRKEEKKEETTKKGKRRENSNIPHRLRKRGGGLGGWAPSIFWVRGLEYFLAPQKSISL